MIKTQDAFPSPPNLIRSFVVGFDTLTTNIVLILIPVIIDLLIWLVPRLSIKRLLNRLIADFMAQSQALGSDLQAGEMLTAAQEVWQFAADHFNLFMFLRTYPVGVPSLMSSLLPIENPSGAATAVEISSFLIILGLMMVLTLIGLIIGTFYFILVSQAAVQGEIRWRKAFSDWPWMSLQVVFLALIWLMLFVGISVPASCGISIASLGNLAFGQCAVLLFGGLLIWLIFPLLLSSHGIFVNRQKVWPSMKRGIFITRMTLPSVSLFFMTVLLLTQILDLLWRIPPASSWLMLVGIAGHAFATTGFLMASFVYYHQADTWIQSMQAQQDENKLQHL